jgi:hypothetical protein
MRRPSSIRVLSAAAVLLALWGANPGAAAAASPSETLRRHELAIFEWHRLSQVNAKVGDQRLASLRADGFKTVYADVGEYLEVFDQPSSRTQQTRLSQLSGELRRFVARASSFGLAVHAVGGGPNWTDATRRYLGPKLLDLVAGYNRAAAATERLQGVQFDIEPHVDPSFWDDVEVSLHDYLTTLQDIVIKHEQLRDPDDPAKRLRLGFAIPFWFDGDAPDVPAVSFGDAGEAPAAFHLIDMLAALPEAYVLVMAYRNVTSGDDGSIAHVRTELDHAQRVNATCGIVVGQEFNRVTPEKLTFWWAGRAAFWRAAEELAGELALAEEDGGYAQFRGISVNDLSAYQAARA